VEITELSATELAAGVRGRSLTAVEVVDAFAERIEAADRDVNAVVVRSFDAARAEARVADAAVEAGEPVGPLHGVPVTVKEAIAVEGLPWTNGSRLRSGVRAERDAAAVRHLRRAGAIVIGKTNVPEFCLWYDTDNDVYGRTANPHRRDRTPGGSSGGEAAALAARMTPLGVGSDFASSIRQPAAWSGVFGLKPSRGAVSLDGHQAFGIALGFSQFGSIGPMARTAADLTLGLTAMTGRPLPAASPAPWDVAVFEEDGLQPVARACRAAVRRAAEAARAAGHRVEDATPPSLAEIRPLFDTILSTELHLLGPAAVGDRLGDLSPYGRRVLERAGEVEPDLRAYVGAASQLAELEFAVDEWLDGFDLVLCPVVPTVAPVAAEGLVEVDGQPMRPGGKLTIASWVNTLGLSGASVPCGLDTDGLPLAVQVVGRRGRDADVLAMAALLEEALGGSPVPPSQ
jgi:aspartyl-tRNA(Asn)/glutamyl-tRNA(Gln) amidotransferase subunit A